MALPTKEYPAAAPVEVERFMGVRLEFTPDGKPCQIHLATSRRAITLNPGVMDEAPFVALWDQLVPSAAALEALMEAAPDMTDEERGVAVAASEPIVEE